MFVVFALSWIRGLLYTVINNNLNDYFFALSVIRFLACTAINVTMFWVLF